MGAEKLHGTSARSASPTTRECFSRRTRARGRCKKRLDSISVESTGGGEPALLPATPLYGAGNGGLHRRRDPLRRDDPPVGRRRDAVSGGAGREGRRAGHQGRHRRARSRAVPGREGDGGARRAAPRRAPRGVPRARCALRQVACCDHDRRRHPDGCVSVGQCPRPLVRVTPPAARRSGSSRSSSPRC